MGHHAQAHATCVAGSNEGASHIQPSAIPGHCCAKKVGPFPRGKPRRLRVSVPSRSTQNLLRREGNPELFSLHAVRRLRGHQCVRSSSCPHISTASSIEGADPRNLSATLANL